MNFNIPPIVAGIALVALVCLAHSLDYREIRFDERNRAEAAIVAATPEDLFRAHRDAKFYVPYGEADCRAPKPVNEYRAYLEWCTEGGPCYRTCSIVPRDPNAKRSDNKKRVFTKS